MRQSHMFVFENDCKVSRQEFACICDCAQVALLSFGEDAAAFFPLREQLPASEQMCCNCQPERLAPLPERSAFFLFLSAVS